MTDDQVPTRATIVRYRGELYEAPILDADWVGLTPHGPGQLSERFPDAIEFVEGRVVGPWVKMPRSALESAFLRRVTAEWRGLPVEVIQLLRSGPDKGELLVWYRGDSGIEASAAGFQGSDYGGWETNVKPSELSDVKVEMVEMPVQRT